MLVFMLFAILSAKTICLTVSELILWLTFFFRHAVRLLARGVGVLVYIKGHQTLLLDRRSGN
jgi:hypothetical protein